METTGSLASQMNVNQNKLDKMDGSQEDMMKAMLEAYLEKMEASPGEMMSVAENKEVRNEEATVETIGAAEHRTRDRAVPARRKGRSHKGPRRTTAATSRKERTSVRIIRKIIELEIEKRVIGSSTGLRKVTEHFGRVGPSETKEKTSKAQTSERKKWRYSCRLFGTTSLKEGAV
jgi:hypothetical protein